MKNYQTLKREYFLLINPSQNSILKIKIVSNMVVSLSRVNINFSFAKFLKKNKTKKKRSVFAELSNQ